MTPNPIDWKKYVIVFLITLSLFFVAGYISNYFSDKKLSELESIQDNIALDILSSETQFALLSELSCKNITESALSKELGEMGQKLEWSEKNLSNTAELLYLRKYYSLLEIKDYLLLKNISERCGNKYAFVLYFYTTAENCSECERQGMVLSALREKYPTLRVYSFDYSTALSAVEAMLEIYKIEDTKLPAVVLDDEVLTGFQSMEELEEMIEASFGLKEEDAEAEEDTLLNKEGKQPADAQSGTGKTAPKTPVR
ncbi:MAG TPA: thioredoxin family protein [Candidatus Paceibacterota bacterium]|nr:thioredoxin family protein [Candidatus Paceibacterota bacterium]